MSCNGAHSPLRRSYFHIYTCFFFSSRRRHTRFKCDWSSDVCSSDLPQTPSWCWPPCSNCAMPQSKGKLRLRNRLFAGSLARGRSEEHTSELQSHLNLVCRLLLEKKKTPVPAQNALERRTTAATESDGSRP